MAKVPLRAGALILLLVAGSRMAAAQSAALDDPPLFETEIAQAEGRPANNSTIAQTEEPARQPAEPPLAEIPETTVVGQPAGSGAQGNPLSGNTEVTTPTRTGTALGEIGSSISVVTAEQIAQKQITTLTDALRELPGVNVVQTGGYGGTTSVFFRGAASEQTKVLLDGIWMNDPSSPGRGFDFSQMSIDNIDRIEVIRGPQSSLYGSDAIGGVINIITKKGSGRPQARAGIAEGTLHTQRQWANITGGTQLFNYSLGGSYFGTQNISQADSQLPGNAASNHFSLGNLSSRIGFTPFENLSLDFIVRYNHGNSKVDNSNVNNLNGAFQDNVNAKSLADDVYTRTQLRYITPGGFWEQKVSLNTTNVHNAYINPSTPTDPLDSSNDRFLGQTQFIDWQNNFFLHKTNTLTVGLFKQAESATSVYNDVFGGFPSPFVQPRTSISDKAVYAQDQIKLFDRWFTTIGGRSDDYSLAGTAGTYRLTSLFRFPVTNTAIRGSLGTGFKAPTLFQLFAFAPNQQTPTALKPEESKGWDYGFDQPFFENKFVISGTYFRNDFTNLIQFQPDPANPFGGSYFNVGRAQSEGAEAAVTWNVNSSTYATVNYTRLSAMNLDTGNQLLRQPHNQIGWNVNRKVLDNRLNLNFNGSFVGRRTDQDFTNSAEPLVTLKGYTLLNLAATYDLRPNWQVFGRLNNILDQHYQSVFGYGSLPINFFGGTNFTW